MNATQQESTRAGPYNGDVAAKVRHGEDVEIRHEKSAHFHVNWTAVWIGALAAFTVLVLFGLVGIALGAYLVGPEYRAVDLKKLGMWTLVFSVCGAFFSSAIGGWVAAKIAGILHSEPAMLHGAFVWLLTVPILVVGASLGASSLFGGWYGGLATNSATTANIPFVHPDPLGANPSPEEMVTFRTQQAEYSRNAKQWHEDTPRATRTALWGR